MTAFCIFRIWYLAASATLNTTSRPLHVNGTVCRRQRQSVFCHLQFTRLSIVYSWTLFSLFDSPVVRSSVCKVLFFVLLNGVSKQEFKMNTDEPYSHDSLSLQNTFCHGNGDLSSIISPQSHFCDQLVDSLLRMSTLAFLDLTFLHFRIITQHLQWLRADYTI